MSRLTRLHRSLAVAATLCAFAAPAAGAAQDLRSPDTRDAVTRTQSAPEPHGLRSPDTRIVATGEQEPSPAPVTTAPHGPSMLPWLLGAGLALLGVAAAVRQSLRRRHVAV